METSIKYAQTSNYFILQAPPPSDRIQIQDILVPWALAVLYLCLVLDSELFFTLHLRTVANNKVTNIFCNIFSLLARDSALTHSKQLTPYKLIILTTFTYAASVCCSTCSSNFLRLQVIQSKYFRIICNHPRQTPTSHLHYTLKIDPSP